MEKNINEQEKILQNEIKKLQEYMGRPSFSQNEGLILNQQKIVDKVLGEIQELRKQEDLGFSALPLNDNHIIGFEERTQTEYEPNKVFKTKSNTDFIKVSVSGGERTRLFVDMDGVLNPFNKVENLDVLYEEGYFRDLQPYENVVQTIQELIHQDGINLYILSAALDSPFAIDEKREWLHTYLPEIEDDHMVFSEYGKPKTKFIPGGVQSSDVLLDDFTNNLLEWNASGAKGIKLLNGINDTQKTWTGFCVDRNDSNLTDSLVNKLSNLKVIDNLNKQQLSVEEYLKIEDLIYQAVESKKIYKELNTMWVLNELPERIHFIEAEDEFTIVDNLENRFVLESFKDKEVALQFLKDRVEYRVDIPISEYREKGRSIHTVSNEDIERYGVMNIKLQYASKEATSIEKNIDELAKRLANLDGAAFVPEIQSSMAIDGDEIFADEKIPFVELVQHQKSFEQEGGKAFLDFARTKVKAQLLENINFDQASNKYAKLKDFELELDKQHESVDEFILEEHVSVSI